MNIRFKFDPQKALQAMAYVVSRLGTVEKVKLMKLLYIADRDHFLKTGVPITGDRLVAMPHGPLPSACLAMLDGTRAGQLDAFEVLHLDDVTVSLKRPVATDRLSSSEIEELDRVVAEHGKTRAWQLVDKTHQFPEYQQTYIDGTSTTIPYELILQLHGDENQFMLGKPVISPAMAQQMVCPFRPGEDSDL